MTLKSYLHNLLSDSWWSQFWRVAPMLEGWALFFYANIYKKKNIGYSIFGLPSRTGLSLQGVWVQMSEEHTHKVTIWPDTVQYIQGGLVTSIASSSIFVQTINKSGAERG